MNTYFVVYKLKYADNIVENNIVLDFKSDILTTEDIREFELTIKRQLFPDTNDLILSELILVITNLKILK